MKRTKVLGLVLMCGALLIGFKAYCLLSNTSSYSITEPTLFSIRGQMIFTIECCFFVFVFGLYKVGKKKAQAQKKP